MNTLYMTDLDGTFLQPDQSISPRTAAIINQLAAQGCRFSICTARSLIGLQMLPLDQVRFTAPMVLMNGVMLYDYEHRTILDQMAMSPAVVAQVVDICARHGKAKAAELFRQAAEYDTTREAVYFSMQDTRACLQAVQQELAQEVPSVTTTLYKDNYMENNWYLEIFDCRAGKDNGVRRVKQRLGADRLVVFGDNDNDLPMLHIADVACVVGNGVPTAQAAADVIIGRNDQDGVAVYMQQDWAAQKE